MSLSPNTIKAAKGARRTSKRLGRGDGSQKGSYSSRGMKGQRARSGGKSKTALWGVRTTLRKAPKLRGFKSIVAPKEVITLQTLNSVCKDGDTVTPWTLNKIGVVDKPQNGVKIVARGELSKKLTIKECIASKGALEAIEKAGGTLIV